MPKTAILNGVAYLLPAPPGGSDTEDLSDEPVELNHEHIPASNAHTGSTIMSRWPYTPLSPIESPYVHSLNPDDMGLELGAFRQGNQNSPGTSSDDLSPSRSPSPPLAQRIRSIRRSNEIAIAAMPLSAEAFLRLCEVDLEQAKSAFQALTDSERHQILTDIISDVVADAAMHSGARTKWIYRYVTPNAVLVTALVLASVIAANLGYINSVSFYTLGTDFVNTLRYDGASLALSRNGAIALVASESLLIFFIAMSRLSTNYKRMAGIIRSYLENIHVYRFNTDIFEGNLERRRLGPILNSAKLANLVTLLNDINTSMAASLNTDHYISYLKKFHNIIYQITKYIYIGFEVILAFISSYTGFSYLLLSLFALMNMTLSQGLLEGIVIFLSIITSLAIAFSQLGYSSESEEIDNKNATWSAWGIAIVVNIFNLTANIITDYKTIRHLTQDYSGTLLEAVEFATYIGLLAALYNKTSNNVPRMVYYLYHVLFNKIQNIYQCFCHLQSRPAIDIEEIITPASGFDIEATNTTMSLFAGSAENEEDIKLFHWLVEVSKTGSAYLVKSILVFLAVLPMVMSATESLPFVWQIILTTLITSIAVVSGVLTAAAAQVHPEKPKVTVLNDPRTTAILTAYQGRLLANERSPRELNTIRYDSSTDSSSDDTRGYDSDSLSMIGP